MKQLFFFSILSVAIVSCVSKSKHEQEVAKYQSSRDSMEAVVNNRDTEIGKFLSDFNEIQMNLDSIKQIEDMIDLNSGKADMAVSAKKKIINDFNRLQQLLAKNKKLIGELRWLRNKDLKKNKELVQTIALLEKQMQVKDSVINELDNKISYLNINVSKLETTVDKLSSESEQKSQALIDKENRMNEAWFTIGNEKDLVEKGLLEKVGGFIGLGKTVRISKNLSNDDFQMVDMRTFGSTEVVAKEAKLISVHPEGSYHFDGEEKAIESLVIDDPSKFWSVTKYLIIVAE